MTLNRDSNPVKTAQDIRRLYDQEAARYQSSEGFTNLLGLKKLRQQLMSTARGKILEVACGTGENLPHYPAGSDVTGIDLSSGMLARARALKLGLSVDLQLMDAAQMQFADNTFDTVVSTMSTCTFPDPLVVLREMQRVCKPDGRILLLEHGRSRYRLLASYQDRTAARKYASDGCRWNQNPLQVVQDAGLNVTSAKRALAGIFFVIEAAPAS